MELEKRLREALDALERERRAHVHTRETLTAQVIKEVMDREITVLECRALVQRRDKLREHMIRQLLERRRAVRVARLVNRLRHPYHKVDGDFASEVFRRVQRLSLSRARALSLSLSLSPLALSLSLSRSLSLSLALSLSLSFSLSLCIYRGRKSGMKRKGGARRWA